MKKFISLGVLFFVLFVLDYFRIGFYVYDIRDYTPGNAGLSVVVILMIVTYWWDNRK